MGFLGFPQIKRKNQNPQYLVTEVNSFSTLDVEINSLLLYATDIRTLIIDFFERNVNICVAINLKREQICFKRCDLLSVL